MSKFIKWITEHVRPYYRRIDSKKPEKELSITKERIEDLKENSEIGIKFKFKF